MSSGSAGGSSSGRYSGGLKITSAQKRRAALIDARITQVEAAIRKKYKSKAKQESAIRNSFTLWSLREQRNNILMGK